MSKWMKNKEALFQQFKEKKSKESELTGVDRVKIVWKTPDKGTAENPKVYQLRLLMDKNDNFYKTMLYHMFYSNSTEKWNFLMCPKTYNFSNYCPFCAAVSKLYMGSKADKAVAYNMKRKTKHCCNVYVVKDSRDTDKIDEEKSAGKVLIYEFPSKVESKISAEMNDGEYGGGINIFDPSGSGFDFILKVGATKPIQEEGPNRGKTFPDYGDSKFANKPSPLADSDEVIDRIMESRHDLDAYIKSMDRTPEEMVTLLKQEFLWDLVSNEASVKLGIKNETCNSEEQMDKSMPEEDVKSSESSPSAADDSDEDFLKELDNL